MNLPKDPAILLSVVNTKLRDSFPTLEAFCRESDIDQAELEATLHAAGYDYDEAHNRFR